MVERNPEPQAAAPHLPWYGTYIALAGVVLAAVIRPDMPHGIVDFARRLAGLPLTLDTGHGSSVSLVEERFLNTGCSGDDMHWSPDGSILVAACPEGVRAWTLDGHRIGTSTPVAQLQRIRVMTDPFQLAYISDYTSSAGTDREVNFWNVGTGSSRTLPLPDEAIDSFVIDEDHDQLVTVRGGRQDGQLSLLPLQGGQATRTFPITFRTWSMRMLPGSRSVLLGGFDGVLRVADIENGDVRELARPYLTIFPKGGRAEAFVDGLVLSPDAKSVATFKTGGRIGLDPEKKGFDTVAAKRWEESRGTDIEIRSIDDGRLLGSMPGLELDARDLAWDPRDRFLAVAGRNALFLWHRQSGKVALRTYDYPGAVAINPDGTRLALTASGGIRIFRITESQPSPTTASLPNTGK